MPRLIVSRGIFYRFRAYSPIFYNVVLTNYVVFDGFKNQTFSRRGFADFFSVA